MVTGADALVTALVNLLDNAYKYSGEEKQITLNGGAENGSVRVGSQPGRGSPFIISLPGAPALSDSETKSSSGAA